MGRRGGPLLGLLLVKSLVEYRRWITDSGCRIKASASCRMTHLAALCRGRSCRRFPTMRIIGITSSTFWVLPLLLCCWLLPSRAMTTDYSNAVELIVDVDAGADDAMALLELLAAEQLNDPSLTRTKVVAITCVSGNAPLEDVVRNVFAILRVAGREDIPVFVGTTISILRQSATATLYGQDGFGDFLPPPGDGVYPPLVQQEHAVMALIRMVRHHPGRFTLLAIAPLTNIALAQRIDPSFLENVKEVYVNGAVAYGGGNQGEPGKEINVNFDPEAAYIVYNSTNKKINLMPSETVNDLRVSKKWRIEVLGTVGTPQVQLLNQVERMVLEDGSDSWVNANGLMAATVLNPATVRERIPGKLLVATSEGLARGATFVDFKGRSGPENVLVLQKPDSQAFMDLALRLLSVKPIASGEE